MIKPFFEDTVLLFLEMLSISVPECAVILVGFVLCNHWQVDSMN